MQCITNTITLHNQSITLHTKKEKDMANPSFKNLLKGAPKKAESTTSTKPRKTFQAVELESKPEKKSIKRQPKAISASSKLATKKEAKISKNYTMTQSHFSSLNKLADQGFYKNYATAFRAMIDFADTDSLIKNHNKNEHAAKGSNDITAMLLKMKNEKKGDEGKISRTFRMEQHQIDKIEKLTKELGFQADSEAVRLILDSTLSGIDFDQLYN